MHARVKDAIRTGKDTGIGKFPSHQLPLNRVWFTAALTATLLSWLRLLALDGDLAKAGPKTLATASSTPPAAWPAVAAGAASKSPPPGPGHL